MRKQVALIAACAMLICCIAFGAMYSRAAFNNMTETATRDLIQLCRMSAEYLDTAAFSTFDGETEVTLDALAAELNVGLAVLDEKGIVQYDTRKLANMQKNADGDDLEDALANGLGTDVRKYRNVPTVFVSLRAKSGLIVRVWGWSGYFVELDACYQDHVINRIKYTL